jgi:hypothetical protein
MADAVTSKTIFNGTKKLIMHFTNKSDGTGESSVVKVDKSTFTGPNGAEPSSIVIDKIEGVVNGGILTIQANHTATLTLAQLNPGGRVCLDFSTSGGLQTSGSGGTGDIEFTLPASLTNGGYDIILFMRKKD